MDLTVLAATGVSIFASGIVGLITWGLKVQIRLISSEIRLVRSEIETELGQAEIRFYKRINGSYVRIDLFREAVARMERIENKIEEIG